MGLKRTAHGTVRLEVVHGKLHVAVGAAWKGVWGFVVIGFAPARQAYNGGHGGCRANAPTIGQRKPDGVFIMERAPERSYVCLQILL